MWDTAWEALPLSKQGHVIGPANVGGTCTCQELSCGLYDPCQ